jgi:hypothetical protein
MSSALKWILTIEFQASEEHAKILRNIEAHDFNKLLATNGIKALGPVTLECADKTLETQPETAGRTLAGVAPTTEQSTPIKCCHNCVFFNNGCSNCGESRSGCGLWKTAL